MALISTHEGYNSVQNITANIKQNAEHATNNFYNLKNKHKNYRAMMAKKKNSIIQHIHSEHVEYNFMMHIY